MGSTRYLRRGSRHAFHLPSLLSPLAIAVAMAGAPAGALSAQAPLPPPVLSDSTPRAPFPVGEILEYQVHVSLGGNIGRGQMRVEGPVQEHGITLWRLVSEMHARRAFVRASDRSTSWFDPARFATRRFEKVERSPLGSGTERVEIDAEGGTWRGTDGSDNPLASPQPLDELSFLYFLRTLPLDREGSFSLTRHYDESRNPTLVNVGAEEVVETPLGSFRTRVVVMHVRDPKHYKGIGLIKVNVDLSACHLPVRIVSRMPIVGTTTLTLVARSTSPRRIDAPVSASVDASGESDAAHRRPCVESANP
ncbi:DUF3108 domain-containing protein [Gemmatimonas aurantiaca]|uniref:DUF3108 domain-containing protein n=1 Tax=Gemmatimonas aurantiaca TaxID=173480 RepID=UPI00301C22EC